MTNYKLTNHRDELIVSDSGLNVSLDEARAIGLNYLTRKNKPDTVKIYRSLKGYTLGNLVGLIYIDKNLGVCWLECKEDYAKRILWNGKAQSFTDKHDLMLAKEVQAKLPYLW